ncbi:MAG: TonB-dependent receptor [Novosphingobium sp.]|nr:TonB-dependent receptor [Novosphingobium sp.]
MKTFIGGLSASRRAGLYASAALLGLLVPAAAHAQDAGEARPATDHPGETQGQGNEIVVTATKHEQTLQDVPVAVSVVTGDLIEKAHIRDIKDLSTLVPSLRVSEHQSSAQTDFLIRGFGNGANNAGIEPSVGVFIDGVYRSRSAAQIADFPDVSRVEVLRGPQSTLFGKNASVGVISIVTQSPQFRFGGNVEASYGNYNAVVLKGMVTGPITQTLAASLSAGYNRRDGIVHDLGTGHDTNDRNRWFIRGQLLFEPTDQLKVRLIGDYGKIDEICCATVNVQSSSSTLAIQALGGRVNSPSDPFGNVVYNNFDSTNHIKNYGVSGQIDYEVGPVTLTSITADRQSNAITNQDSDFTSADLLGRNSQDLRIRTFTQEFRANANIADKLNVLLGAYYFNEKIRQANQLQWGTQARPYANLLIQQLSGRTVPSLEALFGSLQGNPSLYTNQFFAAGQGFDEHYSLNDEAISLFGQADFKVTDRLTLTGGINFTHDSKHFAANIASSDVFSKLDLNALRNLATNAGISQTVGGLLGVPGGFASPAQIGAFAAANPAGFAAVQAGAANATLPLLGLRALQFFPPFLNLPNVVEPGRTSDNNVSWTARIAFDATRHINLYLSAATGFKASSVNLSRDSRPSASDAAAINAAGIAVTNLTYGSRFAGPEKSTVYEAGLKANWGIATANIAVFKQIIRGFQSNIFTGTGFYLSNAGKQSTFGIEFEGTVHPAPELTLGTALTYLDPKYDSYVLSPFGDASGQIPAGIPPISVTFSGQWDHRLVNGDHVILRGDYHYESSVQIEDGLPGFIVKNPITGAVIDYGPGLAAARPFRRAVNEVDASLTYAMHNGLELSVWGRNLIDSRYLTVIFDSPAQQGSISGYPNQPRTFGASARFHW